MATIKFEDYKGRITEAVQEKLRAMPIPGENGFALVEGFIIQTLNDEVSGNIIIGGQAKMIPLVAIVGNTSGRMYYFALKALGIKGLGI